MGMAVLGMYRRTDLGRSLRLERPPLREEREEAQGTTATGD